MPKSPTDFTPSDLSRYAAQGRWDLLEKIAKANQRSSKRQPVPGFTITDIQTTLGKPRKFEPNPRDIWDTAEIKYEPDSIILEETDEENNEKNSAKITIQKGEVSIEDLESGMSIPISAYPMFRKVTPESLSGAINKWWNETIAWMSQHYEEKAPGWDPF